MNGMLKCFSMGMSIKYHCSAMEHHGAEKRDLKLDLDVLYITISWCFR